MSNFASLLDDLKDSAKKASEEAATSSSPLNPARRTHSQKRSLDQKYESDDNHADGTHGKRRMRLQQELRRSPQTIIGNDKCRLPRDTNQLSIKIDFLCIGAQKAGTTWLHENLSRIPQFSLPTSRKELHFWDWNRCKGLGWYSRQFSSSNTSPKQKFGEITPCYAVLDEHSIAEIKSLFPRAKLIFIARDLVERAWSALLMELRNSVRGMDAGQFSNQKNTKQVSDKRELGTTNRVVNSHLEQKWKMEADPNRYSNSYFMERLQHSTHSSRSNYAMSLRMWLKYFSKDQLLILDFRTLSDQPKDVLRRVCDHVGVEWSSALESCLLNEDLNTKINATPVIHSNCSIRSSLRKDMESYLEPFTTDFNLLLEELGYEWKLSKVQ